MIGKKDRIYVAGHKGLVGSAIYNALQAKGYEHVVGRSHAELDLMDGVAVHRFFEEEHPDVVVLAAAKVGGIMANSMCGADFIYQNLQIQQNVIGEAFRSGVKKLLFLGSTCIYPRMAPQPMKEESLLTASLEPTNEPYALAKIAGLKMCEAFNRQYGTDYISVMPTNLYGPNDNFDLVGSHVLPGMLRKILLSKYLMDGDADNLLKDLRKRPVDGVDPASPSEGLAQYGVFPDRVELWGTGAPLREFLWSEDMADACVFLLEHVDAPQMMSLGSSFVNIGTGKEVTISYLANLIAETVGYRGRILFDASKPDGTPRKLTDPSRLHALGWNHSVELPDGVERLYLWYRQSLDQ
ncbi:MAG: GDP-L-fucose synthase [Bacteroidales bacterium]|nr:GDP-L-fucose synthase [Bacteroidales bacterium]